MPSPAERLLAARRDHAPIPWREVLPADTPAAYAVQDATLPALGPVGGWKVGAKSPAHEPAASPLAASGLVPSGATFTGTGTRLRGVEAEVALRVRRDLGAELPSDPDDAFDAVLPVIEVVESRYADFPGSDPLAQLADFQSHGALVLGAPSALSPGAVDLRSVEAVLTFDGRAVATTRGGNPAADVWRMLRWLAAHAAGRGLPLRAGQIVTTGSLTGMLFAEAGTRVEANLAGIGAVSLRF